MELTCSVGVGPRDPDGGVVPAQAALGLARPRTAHFVAHLGMVGECQQTVREAGRYPQHAAVDVVEPGSEPVSETERVAPQVDSRIEYRLMHAPHQLALGGRSGLPVEPTQHATPTASVVVLNEVDSDAQFAQSLLVPRFAEPATFVSDDLGFQDADPGQGRIATDHAAGSAAGTGPVCRSRSCR